MKSLFLYLIILLGQVNISGQQYQLLPEQCTFCGFLASWAGTSSWTSLNYELNPNSDTLINGNTYLLIEKYPTFDQPIGVRQVGNKLFGIQSDSINEVLIMDFDAEIGDTITNLFSEGLYYDAIVTVKDSVLVNNGTYHHFMNLSGLQVFHNGIPQVDFWNIGWNERGLCGVNGAYEWGGVWFNIPSNQYVISATYSLPHFCTTDSTYSNINGASCDNCNFIPNGIHETETIEFDLYPVPSKNEVNIVFENEKMKKIRIIGFDGKIIDFISTSDSKISYNLSNFASGIYFIYIVTEDGIGRKKIIKQ